MNKKTLLLVVIIIGLIIPFIPVATIIEMFYFLIPFFIILLVTLIYLILSILYKKQDIQKAVFIFLILPIFILSQIVSGLVVDKIQKIRSALIIKEIHKIKTKTGNFPEQYHVSCGIEYRKLTKNAFEISYLRGFMVTEKYDSENKIWNSYGWND